MARALRTCVCTVAYEFWPEQRNRILAHESRGDTLVPVTYPHRPELNDGPRTMHIYAGV